MAGYMVTSVMNARLDAAAAAATAATGSFCSHQSWTPGHAGASVGYVKIGATTGASPTERWSVLVSGGVHARELAPPDALVSFVEKLVAAYTASSDVVYPSWTSPVDGVVYSSFTVPWPKVRAVVENLDLYIAPCVNADGRDFVLAPLPSGATSAQQRLHKDWRKNRRPAPPGAVGDSCVGVDLNRNFDINWDYKKAYAPSAGVGASDDPCDFQVYKGPFAGSEPETHNLANLMDTTNVSYFLDVHSYGRDILYPWGIETDQTTDPAQSFLNPSWDGKRDGNDPAATAYQEYIPQLELDVLKALGQRMADWILNKAGGSDPTAQSRSKYKVMLDALLYPGSVTVGTSDDYCFSRWFYAAKLANPIAPVLAYTIEVGGDPAVAGQDEGGFAPDYVKHYPKIEREIHAAVWAFITAAAASNKSAPQTPPLPSPPPKVGGSDGKSSPDCFIAGAAYAAAGGQTHPTVAFLRDVRDRQLPASRPGGAFAAMLAAAYARVSPPLARWLVGRKAARAAVRVVLVAPLAAVLGLASRATARWPRLRSVVLALIFVIAAAVLAGALALAVAAAAAVLAARASREES
jgi:murein tripeptide amidase MpaA